MGPKSNQAGRTKASENCTIWRGFEEQLPQKTADFVLKQAEILSSKQHFHFTDLAISRAYNALRLRPWGDIASAIAQK